MVLIHHVISRRDDIFVITGSISGSRTAQRFDVRSMEQ